MIIKHCIQIAFESIIDINIDLLICSTGYEDRATYISKALPLGIIGFKTVFAFKDKVDKFSRKKNDTYFTKSNFQYITCDGDAEDEVVEYIKTFLTNSDKSEINIVVDYSCMTRIWYGAILKSVRYNNFNDKSINIFFCYSVAQYTEAPSKETYNIHIGPIRGFTSLSVPQKPTALIIGLGYERNRAIGLNEYFDGETFLFYTDSTVESEYSKEVETKNKEIISSIKRQNIYKYPLTDLNYTNAILTSLCRDLSRDYRVIIAPCGPKPFTLLSLALALALENIDVWRISSGKEGVPVNKSATGEVVAFKIEFSNEDKSGINPILLTNPPEA